MNANIRQFASPYARKLARERGVALVNLAGSGPSGRIVAADILSFTQAAAFLPSPAVQVDTIGSLRPAITVAAIAAEVRIEKVRKLLFQFAALHDLKLETLVLRAAARALHSRGSEGTISLEVGRHERHAVDVQEASTLSIGTLDDLLKTQTAERPAQAIVSIRRIATRGVRVLSTPLLPGHRMRLTLSGNEDIAECMPSFDTQKITEDDAVEWLADVRDALESPLRLFV